MPEVTQYQHIHKVGMEVPLLEIREIGENPGQVSDYVPATTSGLNVLTIHRPPRKSQVFDKMETAGTEITYRCKDCRDCPECKKGDSFESISIQEEVEQTVIERSVNVDIRMGRTIAKLLFFIEFQTYQSQVRKLWKSPEDMDQVIQSEKKLHDLGVGQFSNTGTDNVHCPFGGGWVGGQSRGRIILKNRKIQK